MREQERQALGFIEDGLAGSDAARPPVMPRPRPYLSGGGSFSSGFDDVEIGVAGLEHAKDLLQGRSVAV